MTRLQRRHDPEILDSGVLLDGRPVGERVLARSLDQVAAVDRWLGGARALRGALRSRLRAGAPIDLLDVGTGNGRLLDRLAAHLRSRGHRCRAVGVELDPAVLAVARRHLGPDLPRGEPSARPRLVRADGLRLPFGDDSVDVALAVLTLHHFRSGPAATLLAEMARVARRAVLVSDLRRSVPAWLGARVLAATVWRANPVTRHDGPLSVLRGFTVDELAAIAADAGLSRVRVTPHPLFRLLLEATP